MKISLQLNLQLKEKIIFICLLIFLILSRFWLLWRIPATLPHDEMVYAIQAQSFVLQGKTLDQQQNFWSLRPSHIMYAEWPAQVMALGFLVTDDPFVAVHLVSALMGLLFPFIMASFVWLIWKRADLVKATFVLFVFSPLFWQMSRLSYDAFYGLWFYVLAGTLFISRRRSLVLLSIPVFFLGFFQYQGFKLLLVPWMIFIMVLLLSTRLTNYGYKEIIIELKNLKLQLFILLLGVGLMLFYALILLPNQGASSRLSSVIFMDTQTLEKIVNTERRLSLDNPFAAIVSNKATAVLVFILQRLIGVFNPNTLLLLLEPNVSGFSVWTHGVFYWLEIVLLFVGIVGINLRKKTRLSAAILIMGILTLCLPALINSGGEWYLLRSMFSYLLMTVMAAWGLTYIWQLKKLRLILLAFYAVNIFYFSYNYFYRYPIISLDWGNFDERVMARYIDLNMQENPDLKIIVYGPEAEYDYWSYLFYSGKLSSATATEIAASAKRYQPYVSKEAEYSFGNVTFSNNCAPKNPKELYYPYSRTDYPGMVLVRRNHKTCPISNEEVAEKLNDQKKLSAEELAKAPAVLSISAVLDSGERIQIYGDNYCLPFASTYVNLRNLSQLKLESQDKEVFCSLWIKNLNLVK